MYKSISRRALLICTILLNTQVVLASKNFNPFEDFIANNGNQQQNQQPQNNNVNFGMALQDQQPMFQQDLFGQFNQNYWNQLQIQPTQNNNNNNNNNLPVVIIQPQQHQNNWNQPQMQQPQYYPMQVVQTPTGHYFSHMLVPNNQMRQVPAFSANPFYNKGSSLNEGGMKRLREENRYPYNERSEDESSSSSSQDEGGYLQLVQQIGQDNAKEYSNLETRIHRDLHRSFLLNCIISELTEFVELPEIKQMIFYNFQVTPLDYKLCFYPINSFKSSTVITIPPFVYGRLLTSLKLSANVGLANEWITQCLNLTSLSLGLNEIITNAEIQKLTKLTSLDLSCNKMITDEGIEGLTNITSLDLMNNGGITEGIQRLPNLTSLILFGKTEIRDKVIQKLTNLKCLVLEQNNTITDSGIQWLTSLNTLSLATNHTISNAGIQWLTNLTNLILAWNVTITDAGILRFTNLTELDLEDNQVITNEVLRHLGMIRLGHSVAKRWANITSLDIYPEQEISNADLQKLLNLTSLGLEGNSMITDEGVQGLTNLTILTIGDNTMITNAGVQGLTNLISLHRYGNTAITDDIFQHLGLNSDGEYSEEESSSDVLPPNDEDMAEDH